MKREVHVFAGRLGVCLQRLVQPGWAVPWEISGIEANK